ncbi:MAG: hypothetical protein Q4B67_00105 [Eubacteriales bacterium]|nr:hypothetical protein [Eubacteriales bacterium]
MDDNLKKIESSLKRTVLLIVLLLFTLISATFAWFTFNTATNVTPMRGSVSGTGITLLISDDPDGVFEKECNLNPYGGMDEYELEPVSTANLDTFFEAVAMDENNYAIRFRDVTDEIDSKLIRGTVYLKSVKKDAMVYLDPSKLMFDYGAQLLSSMRLGLRITGENGSFTYIFRLDDYAGGAEELQTVETEGTVVGDINSDGEAQFEDDPSIQMSDYFADVDADGFVTPGNEVLIELVGDEVATVEYWFYIEGCDNNTFNEVQDTAGAVTLAFAGCE